MFVDESQLTNKRRNRYETKSHTGIANSYSKIHQNSGCSTYTNAFFCYQDREDLEQELWLFYFQKLKAFQNPRVNEGFFFIAIRNKALEMLRTQKRQIHYSQQYINEELLASIKANPIKNTEDQETVSKMFAGLTLNERECLLLIMGGANIRETGRLLNVSKESIYKILKKLKENFES